LILATWVFGVPGMEGSSDEAALPLDLVGLWNDGDNVMLVFDIVARFETRTFPAVMVATAGYEAETVEWEKQAEYRFTCIAADDELNRIREVLAKRHVCIRFGKTPPFWSGSGVQLRMRWHGHEFFADLGHNSWTSEVIAEIKTCLDDDNKHVLVPFLDLVRTRIENQAQ
jgi:hypothetical protein